MNVKMELVVEVVVDAVDVVVVTVIVMNIVERKKLMMMVLPETLTHSMMDSKDLEDVEDSVVVVVDEVDVDVELAEVVLQVVMLPLQATLNKQTRKMTDNNRRDFLFVIIIIRMVGKKDGLSRTQGIIIGETRQITSCFCLWTNKTLL